ncbi:uncharacterized protein LOC126904704 [Daktulosphaira vitifoliae]|uniref:uncharacterized protein LOC126904704 n=1 Tax=Daktulosphaira vitifoliae TaxID=58002 RepID=UPI0021AA0CDE|nr:uncharacterized protein LOC126904704 [Daktulosphaira vitifoliae]
MMLDVFTYNLDIILSIIVFAVINQIVAMEEATLIIRPCGHDYCQDCALDKKNSNKKMCSCGYGIKKIVIGIDNKKKLEDCAICLSRESDVMFENCKHFFCNFCTNRLIYKNDLSCPTCRGEVMDYVGLVDLTRKEALVQDNGDPQDICQSCYGEICVVKIRPCRHRLCESCYETIRQYNFECPKCSHSITRFDPIADYEACIFCNSEHQSWLIKPCHHEIGSSCFTQVMNKNQLCPKCKIKIDSSYNIECIFCHEEKMSVILFPCCHKIGHECKNRIPSHSFNCPICQNKIEKLVDIESFENCILCFDEKPSVTLDPCTHQFGNSCSIILKQKKFNCPICRRPIDNFIDLDETRNVIHPQSCDDYELMQMLLPILYM